VAVAINLTKKVDVDLLRQHQQRKRRNVGEACGLLRAVKNLKKWLLHIWRICGE
jgi:hypothetical protein